MRHQVWVNGGSNKNVITWFQYTISKNNNEVDDNYLHCCYSPIHDSTTKPGKYHRTHMNQMKAEYIFTLSVCVNNIIHWMFNKVTGKMVIFFPSMRISNHPSIHPSISILDEWMDGWLYEDKQRISKRNLLPFSPISRFSFCMFYHFISCDRLGRSSDFQAHVHDAEIIGNVDAVTSNMHMYI